MGLRAMTFVSSLAMLALIPPGGRPYPTRGFVLALVAFTSIGLFHPNLNTVTAGIAQIGLTIAVWCPIFWATRFRLPPNALRTAILMLWGFNAVSSVVGVLQVYDPNQFTPDPNFARSMIGIDIEGQKIELADGQIAWRPMGLTDTPGGASVSGQFAFLTGVILAITERHMLLRIAEIIGAISGMFCIYLSQVRTSIVLLAITVLVYVILSAACRRAERAALVSLLGGVAVLAAFTWATIVGGSAVADRFISLAEDRPDQVYMMNRGYFLEETFNQINDFPIGAGLGRWGMMSTYFGDSGNPNSQMLWVEIQPTGWLYDGGLLLVIAGYAALFGCCWVSIRIALANTNPQVADWAAVIAALDVAMAANTLTYPVFTSQTGMTYLMLNGIVFAAAAYRPAEEAALATELD
jgi:hypothetical protein